MSNQVIMWFFFFLLPWLTLVFMKKEDIRRFMPVAMAAIVTSVSIYDAGITLHLWEIQSTFYPFSHLHPYSFGTLPVLTMWVLKFTYTRFWLYMTVNTILDIGFNFLILDYLFPRLGILALTVSPFVTLPITLIHAVVLYGYQRWQEGAPASSPATDQQ